MDLARLVPCLAAPLVSSVPTLVREPYLGQARDADMRRELTADQKSELKRRVRAFNRERIAAAKRLCDEVVAADHAAVCLIGARLLAFEEVLAYAQG